MFASVANLTKGTCVVLGKSVRVCIHVGLVYRSEFGHGFVYLGCGLAA